MERARKAKVHGNKKLKIRNKKKKEQYGIIIFNFKI